MSYDHIIGLDLLGVVIERGHEDHYAPQSLSLIPGALEGLIALQYAGIQAVHLFAPPTHHEQGATSVTTWFQTNNVFAKTGLEPDSLIVVPHAGYLTTLCHRLRVTHLVSARVESLRALVPDVVGYLFTPHGITADDSEIITVSSWDALIHHLIAR